MKRYFIWWLITWVVIGAVVMLFVRQPTVLYGVGLAALISLVLMLKTTLEAWSGEIVEIRSERINTARGNDEPLYEDVAFAHIRLVNGKTKKIRSMMGWAPGMTLEKRKGEATIRMVPVRSAH